MAYTRNTKCKVDGNAQHVWSSLYNLEIHSCENMCGVCGKKCENAAVLRKHVKTHLEPGECVTPSKRKGGPMSNLEKRRLEGNQSPTGHRIKKTKTTNRADAAVDNQTSTSNNVLVSLQRRVKAALEIKKEQEDKPFINLPNNADTAIVISDDDDE